MRKEFVVALLLAAGGCDLAPARRANIIVYGADPNPIDVDTSQMPADTTVGVSEGDVGPITTVTAYGGSYRVIIVPTTRPISD